MKLYVGTYAKYNEGKLSGAWLDLTDYADLDDFYEACRELHKDEDDPELMFQDYDDGPEFLYDESALLRDDIYDFIDLDDDDKEMVAAYIENVGLNGSLSEVIDEARDAHQGQWDSFEEFAQQLYEDLYEIPSHLESYIDWRAVASDLQQDYFEENGHIFRNL